MGHSFAVSPVTDSHAIPPLAPSTSSAAFLARGVRDVLVADAPASLVETLPLHGFAMAAHVAYTQHRPLVIGPDAVWLCIAQGIARHISLHAEALRGRLVRHQGQVPIEVRRDELAAQPASVDEWRAAVAGLVDGVRAHLGGRADLFVADFTTTDARSRAASQITLLGAMQQYFHYSVSSLCGIPRVTVRGEPADWAKIRDRLHILDELDLTAWARVLTPLVDELARACAGAPDVALWRRFYKLEHASGGERISGVINALFPYLNDRGDTKNPAAWSPRPRDPDDDDDADTDAGGADDDDDDGELDEFSLPKLSQMPSGVASAPFTWRLLGGDRAMQLVAGFAGVAVADDGASVEAAIGWAVSPAQPARRFRTVPMHGGVVALSRLDQDARTLEGLAEQIALDGLTAVQMSFHGDELATLEGIEHPAVVDVSLWSSDVTDLAPLARAPGLRRLHVQQCAQLVDLAPLAGAHQITSLAVNHCPRVVDYTPLASMRGLVKLDLFGDAVPPAVKGRHEGKDAVAAVQEKLARGLGRRQT